MAKHLVRDTSLLHVGDGVSGDLVSSVRSHSPHVKGLPRAAWWQRGSRPRGARSYGVARQWGSLRRGTRGGRWVGGGVARMAKAGLSDQLARGQRAGGEGRELRCRGPGCHPNPAFPLRKLRLSEGKMLTPGTAPRAQAHGKSPPKYSDRGPELVAEGSLSKHFDAPERCQGALFIDRAGRTIPDSHT